MIAWKKKDNNFQKAKVQSQDVPDFGCFYANFSLALLIKVLLIK